MHDLEVIGLVLYTMVVATQFMPQVAEHTSHWQDAYMVTVFFSYGQTPSRSPM